MSLHIAEFAQLPVGIKHGVGGKLGNRLYVGLGSAGKRLFYYDLERPDRGWQSAPDFPGTERNDAVSAVCNGKLYVFSGAGSEQNGEPPAVLMDGYAFDPVENRWEKLATQAPVGFLGASACEMSEGKLHFWGGYCKETFDTFLSQISAMDAAREPEQYQAVFCEFMSRPIPAYGWNKEIWQFDIQSGKWHIAAQNPYPANCGAALIKDGNKVVLVEGEVKPGLRSLESKAFQFQGDGTIHPMRLPAISETNNAHEGLAGHFGARLENHYLVAGGAYFVGSQHNFSQQKLYSHKGLTKRYDDTVWMFDGKRWETAGQLPEGIAYGTALTVGDSVILLGGERADGSAASQCVRLTYQ
ncbi:YjhT family mutarotase [Enterovibrio paralichthyis]|uniref:YjhT family mutarotase n=1 Tax=Enterovibrio paralichthyis TaxID=2853805 RepID=UPI001C469B42|nr:YjhT family mutarotase [Enterovibrio paralichthyis]MBV7296969.1 YjhT family mutarotase [Enterovibrio paralichthyis]